MLETVQTMNGTAASDVDRYSPSLEEVARLRERGNIIPIYREIFADLETPVSAYLKVAEGPYSFLLESVEGGERLARFSFIGTDPYLTLKFNEGVTEANLHGYLQHSPFTDPLLALREYLAPYQTIELPGLPRFLGGAVGFLSYEAVRYFEKLPTAPGNAIDFPDGLFMFVDTMLVFDHLEHTIKVVSHVHIDAHKALETSYAEAIARIDRIVARLARPAKLPIGDRPLAEAPVAERMVRHTDPQTYYDMVKRAQEYIAAGDIIQVVLSQRVSVETGAHPFTLYRALRRVNPSPYMFFLQMGDAQIIGASPELLVRLDGNTLMTHPIAGTRHRGATDEEDDALARELAFDDKERAEHIMLVDLGRNDIGRVASPGSVSVPQLMEIERYSHVMHLVSHVTGTIRDDLGGIDALRSCFPAGTVSGAPKIRAMEIIAELEPERRGPYAGTVGYVDFSGNLDTAITLRTVVMRGGTAYLQAGGGIVADSTPEFEYNECFHKMGALVRAIDVAERIERTMRNEAEG